MSDRDEGDARDFALGKERFAHQREVEGLTAQLDRYREVIRKLEAADDELTNAAGAGVPAEVYQDAYDARERAIEDVMNTLAPNPSETGRDDGR